MQIRTYISKLLNRTEKVRGLPLGLQKEDVLLHPDSYFYDFEGYGTYSTWIDSLLSIVKDNRKQLILQRRLGIGIDAPQTLKQMAKDMGITPGRISQLEKEARNILSESKAMCLLQPFFETFSSVLYSGGGILRTDNLMRQAVMKLPWSDNPHHIVFVNLLKLSPLFVLKTRNKFVCLNTYHCDSCYEMKTMISEIMGSCGGQMHILDLAYRLTNSCKESCPSSDSGNVCSPDAIEYLASLKMFVIKGEYVFTNEKWKVLSGENLKELIQKVLETIGHPTHYTEIASQARNIYGGTHSITNSRIHRCLSNDETFAMSRRGVYGLAVWSLNRYSSIKTTVIDLLEKAAGPLGWNKIFNALNKEYVLKRENLLAILDHHPRIVRVAERNWDLRERVEERTIARTAAEVRLVSKNNEEHMFSATELFSPTPQTPEYPKKMMECSVVTSSSVQKLIRLMTENLLAAYKPVLLLSILDTMNGSGQCKLDDVVTRFNKFYEDRRNRQLPLDVDNAEIHKIFAGSSRNRLMRSKRIILKNPLRILCESGLFIVEQGYVKTADEMEEILKNSVNIVLLRQAAGIALVNHFSKLVKEMP